ncbi:hypothetical protein Tco_0483579 [Tanacetum coccineum]
MTIINLCLTGKTSGFERPRAPVLQILWGIINRAHIDYAERMWEEFTQSIHTFTEDKKNLVHQTDYLSSATQAQVPSKTRVSPLFWDISNSVLKEPKGKETDTGKFQPHPEVEGKGKEKVGAEQAAQRRTSAPTEPSGHDEPSSLYVELGLTESDTESDEEMPPVVKSGDQDEGQAGPDPGIQDKGQAEPNPDDVAESQPLSTPGVHAGPNLEHTDAEATDATSQPQPGQMDEEFTATAYL